MAFWKQHKNAIYKLVIADNCMKENESAIMFVQQQIIKLLLFYIQQLMPVLFYSYLDACLPKANLFHL